MIERTSLHLVHAGQSLVKDTFWSIHARKMLSVENRIFRHRCSVNACRVLINAIRRFVKDIPGLYTSSYDFSRLLNRFFYTNKKRFYFYYEENVINQNENEKYY